MDAAHVATDKEIVKIQRHLRRIYAAAEKDVAGYLSEWAKSIEAEAARLLKAIRDAETEKQARAAKNAYKRFFVLVVKKDAAFSKTSQEAQKRLYMANSEAVEYINGKTAAIYVLNYNKMGARLENALDGYAFKPVSEDDAEEYGEITRQTVDKKKDESWNAKNIAAAVVSGGLLLLAAGKIAKQAAAVVTQKNRNGANRQASDMLTDAENKGRLDSMYRAYDEGFDHIKKEWVCVFDNRTRDTHIEYNDIGPVDLDYEYNTGLKRPRDPDCSDMADVCNCRCAITYPTGIAKSGTRAVRSGDVKGSYKNPRSFRDTETETISQMSYKDWMKWRS